MNNSWPAVLRLPLVNNSDTMANNNNRSFNGAEVNGSFNESQDKHAELSALVMYDRSQNFHFITICPDHPVTNQVAAFRRSGTIQQLSNGNVDVVVHPRPRSRAELIKKLAHGRVSHTIDNCVQLTLKVSCVEGVNISEAIEEEARIAAKAVRNWQLTR